MVAEIITKNYLLSKLSIKDLCKSIVEEIPDLQGWNSESDLLSKLVVFKNNPLIIEVGVWKGASVISMAKTLAMTGSGGGHNCYRYFSWKF